MHEAAWSSALQCAARLASIEPAMCLLCPITALVLIVRYRCVYVILCLLLVVIDTIVCPIDRRL